jgi:hypothetical protein
MLNDNDRALAPEEVIPRIRDCIDRAILDLEAWDIEERVETQQYPHADLMGADEILSVYWGFRDGEPILLLQLDRLQLIDPHVDIVDFVPACPRPPKERQQ